MAANADNLARNPALYPQVDEAEILTPTVRNLAAGAHSGRIAITAFNAMGGREPGLIAAALKAAPLAGSAIIMMSELDWCLPRSRERRVPQEIADALGFSYAFAPEFAFARQHPEFKAFFGNAILCAAPLHEVRSLNLPNCYDWTRRRLSGSADVIRVGRRGGLVAITELNGCGISIGTAHLENRTSPHNRAIQMKALIDAMAPGPAVIGGDFNTITLDLLNRQHRRSLLQAIYTRRFRRPEQWEPLFEVLAAAGFEYRQANLRDAPTFTPLGAIPRWVRPKLDWLAVRGLKVIEHSAKVVAARRGVRRFSDHDFVTCQVELAAYPASHRQAD